MSEDDTGADMSGGTDCYIFTDISARFDRHVVFNDNAFRYGHERPDRTTITKANRLMHDRAWMNPRLLNVNLMVRC